MVIRMNVPIAGETIASVTSYPELVEAFRAVKARLGLSNKWCDDICGYADGIIDKKLGPSHSKPIDPLAFSMFCEIFAVRFIMVMDLEAAKRMEARWEGRVEGKVSVQKTRMSKELLCRAKPLVLKEHLRAANNARNEKLTCEHRSALASKAAKKRWRKYRKLFKKMGKAGGKASAKSLTAEQRRTRARNAANARWSRTRTEPEPNTELRTIATVYSGSRQRRSSPYA